MIDSETFTYLRAFLALGFVVGLIVVLAAIIKRTGLDKRIMGSTMAGNRLHITETLYLDPRNRLIIVACDTTEYVLLLGATSTLLLETRMQKKSHDIQ